MKLACCWFLLALAAPALAQAVSFDITTGPSVTASERTTAAAFASMFREPPVDGRLHLEPIGTFGWLDSRRTRKDDLDHEVFLVAGGVRILSPGQHWFISEQLAATSTRTDALSSRFEFMTSAGWQDGHFITMLRHVSNAHILGGGKNLGETMLLAGLRW
ncbi:MAG TPA: hypothetical protein VF284_05820 [Rhodanobacteraceae bacterium]